MKTNKVKRPPMWGNVIKEKVVPKDIKRELNGEKINVCTDNLWMELGDVRELKFVNPMTGPEWDDQTKTAENIADFCRRPEYIHFVAKYILNIDLLPFQCVMLQTMWTKRFPIFVLSRGGSKSFMLAVYLVLRMILHQGCRFVIVGASLRQSMVIYNYVQNIYENAPILQDICPDKPKRDLHMCYWKVGRSRAAFLPLGTGEKIRGQRATHIISDEISTIPIEIFETVVRGFAAVRSEGVHMNVAAAYQKEILGKIVASDEEEAKDRGCPTVLDGNQIIMAGTAFYQFNHFYKRFKYYRSVILSGGKAAVLNEEFPDQTVLEDIDSTQYSILRIPYDKLPIGLMDRSVIAQGKATMDPQIYNMEYNAIFASDSQGFYLMSALQHATCPIKTPGGTIDFQPALCGDIQKRCVMGIDPASENDNFAINIIEENTDHRRVLYQWTTNREEFEKLRKDTSNPIKEAIQDYNTFCVTHIRDLKRRFNVCLIVIDAGGGGISLREGLKDPSKLLDTKDECFYDMDDEAAVGLKGEHILKMVNFADSKWRVEAHYGLKKDIADLRLLFPRYDPATVEISTYNDSRIGKYFDTTADCYLEIEQLKQETTLIKHDQGVNGHEKWDVPKIVGMDADQIRKTLRKDRFTSLLLANWGFRFITNYDYIKPTELFGGVASDYTGREITGAPYIGQGAIKMRYMPENNLVAPRTMSVGDNGRRVYY